ncbi:MAG TPA: LysE family translocator [Terricaulis sp.]|jgi:Putative threonine efflux protein|nr:LysE family translocator [Terricaulis sp.]
MDLPIDPAILASFLLAVLLIEATPGPNMGYLAALSAASGRVAGMRAVLGVTLGLCIYMLAAVLGVAQLIAQAPLAYQALRWAGVAFLLYLAWQAWRGADEESPGHASVQSDHAPFWRGLIANVLNPKALVFYVALLPSFVAPERAPYWVQALILGGAHILISIIVHTGIVLVAARAGMLLAQHGRMRIVRRVLAVGIALIAFWLAWDTR